MKLTIVNSGSIGNCYVLHGAKTNIIIELGVTKNKVLQAIGAKEFKKIDFALVTHEHLDHIKYFNQFKLPIYTSAGTNQVIKRGKNLEENVYKRIGEWAILPFATVHDCRQGFGYLIGNAIQGKSLVFATDTNKMTRLFQGVQYYAVEANYDKYIIETNEGLTPNRKKRIIDNHMEIGSLANWLLKCDLKSIKKIILIHESKANSDPATSKNVIESLVNRPCINTANKMSEVQIIDL